jgi:nucleotidyltransferase/DNA polymerase involved in DNA repair
MNMSRKTSLQELRTIPGVGPRIAENMWRLGIRRVADLKGRKPEELYEKLAAMEGRRQDRCVLYTFRCATYYASRRRHDPEKLKWWNWKDKASTPSPRSKKAR